jgi:hypothetical protein
MRYVIETACSRPFGGALQARRTSSVAYPGAYINKLNFAARRWRGRDPSNPPRPANREGGGPPPAPQPLPGKGMVASTTVGSEASGGGRGACWKVLPPGESATHPVYPLIFSLTAGDWHIIIHNFTSCYYITLSFTPKHLFNLAIWFQSLCNSILMYHFSTFLHKNDISTCALSIHVGLNVNNINYWFVMYVILKENFLLNKFKSSRSFFYS